MLVIRGAYIRRGLYSGRAYIRDFTVSGHILSKTFVYGYIHGYQ